MISSIDAVINAAASLFGVTHEDICGPSRIQVIADARAVAVAFLLANKVPKLPIARRLNRCRTTLIYCKKRARECPTLKPWKKALADEMRLKGWS